ncbi:MAG: T9SS type A sorting domain-containing protein, partial [Candidatus Marinimicrobia bacterium]|nr:T9SS type A sorting domain-containing protein [Candidatus Neomarinimicrobiota bacterium]
ADLLPKVFALHQNYPNPFNPTTFIKYDLPKEAKVKIVIYNLMGREVRTLVTEKQNAGYKTVIWNGRNNNGQLVSSGCYIYHMVTDKFQKTKKMTLLK